MYLAANSRVTVSLHAKPSDQTTYVVADGVRLVGVENDVTIDGPVVRSLCGVNGNSNNEDVTVHVSVTVNLPPAHDAPAIVSQAHAVCRRCRIARIHRTAHGVCLLHCGTDLPWWKSCSPAG